MKFTESERRSGESLQILIIKRNNVPFVLMISKLMIKLKNWERATIHIIASVLINGWKTKRDAQFVMINSDINIDMYV